MEDWTVRFALCLLVATFFAWNCCLAGGRLDIETAPGSGTTIYIHIPLQTDQDEGG